MSTFFKSLEKINKSEGLLLDTRNYFFIKDPKSTRFYLLPKIHKRLHDVPGRLAISNCGFFISSFLHFHLQVFAQKVKSYIKETNHFLRKIKVNFRKEQFSAFSALKKEKKNEKEKKDKKKRKKEKNIDPRKKFGRNQTITLAKIRNKCLVLDMYFNICT